jgi:phage-related protein
MMGKVVVDFFCQASGKSPAEDFIRSLDGRSRRKFYFVLELLEEMGHRLPEPYAKYIGNDIFELRFTGTEGAVRVFYFFFHQDRVIITNGFIKKTQKTPDNEKAMAVSRRKEFLGAQGKK